MRILTDLSPSTIGYQYVYQTAMTKLGFYLTSNA